MAAISEMVPPRWFTPDFIARQPAAVAFVVDMLLGTDPAGYAGCGAAIAGMDLRPALGAIKAPTLVIAGAEDQAAPPWQGAMTASGIADVPAPGHPRHIAPGPLPDPRPGHRRDQGASRLGLSTRGGRLAALVRGAGRPYRRARHRQRAAARQPARRPARAAAAGSTCRRATTTSPSRRYPSVYVIQGYTGHVAMWRNRSAVPAAVPRDRRRGVRPRRGAAGHRGLRRRVDRATAAASSSTRRAPAATTPTCATRSCPGSTRATAPCPAPAHRAIIGQVQRRVRRDDHADAPAGPVRRAGHARRRHAVRVLLPPRVRHAPSGTCATTTATSGAGGATSGPGCPSPRRRTWRC